MAIARADDEAEAFIERGRRVESGLAQASRIERMTRVLGTDLVVSDDLFRMLATEAPADERLTSFQGVLTARLTGRVRPVMVRPALPIR